MARFTGSRYKVSRRLGFSTLETGKELAKKPYIPGQHGRFMYGLNEKQFKKVFEKAGKMKGVHGENLLILLESRVDNLVYRLGLSTTRKGARQLVNHGHITVNGRKVDIPSYTCKPGDEIAVKESDREMKIIKDSLEALAKRVDFVKFDEKKMSGTYLRYPQRSELNADVNESLIVEFYNR